MCKWNFKFSWILGHLCLDNLENTTIFVSSELYIQFPSLQKQEIQTKLQYISLHGFVLRNKFYFCTK